MNVEIRSFEAYWLDIRGPAKGPRQKSATGKLGVPARISVVEVL